MTHVTQLSVNILNALTFPPLRAPSPLSVGEERGLSRCPERLAFDFAQPRRSEGGLRGEGKTGHFPTTF